MFLVFFKQIYIIITFLGYIINNTEFELIFKFVLCNMFKPIKYCVRNWNLLKIGMIWNFSISLNRFSENTSIQFFVGLIDYIFKNWLRLSWMKYCIVYETLYFAYVSMSWVVSYSKLLETWIHLQKTMLIIFLISYCCMQI